MKIYALHVTYPYLLQNTEVKVLEIQNFGWL